MTMPTVTIVFPPAADPSLPYGALPLLGAVLRRAGYRDVTLRDVNLEAFDDLLRPEALRTAADRAAGSVPEAIVDELVAEIDEARRVLRDPVDFYDPAKLLYAKRVFHLASELVTAGHPDLSFGKYSYSAAPYDSYADVDAAVSRDGGPLAEYFRAVTVPSLLANRPTVIGLSVPYFSQLIPAFLLAEAIREQDPDVHITCGGPVITWGKEVLSADPRFGRWFDSFFVGEADQTFLHFVEALDGKRDMSSVQNVVRYVDGAVISQIDARYQLDLDWSPTPDFTMLPLDNYFAPKRVICLVPTRGCYFNKCAFCNYAFIKMAPYRMRSPEKIAADIAEIQRACGEDVFCFESDVILPRHLRAIAEAINAADVDVRWHAVARFEKGFSPDLFATMREAGCVRLYMGLESGNDRVLKAMVKGTDSKRMADILAMCHAAGIAVEAGVFSDFPSETAEEAEDTYRFIRDHRHVIARADVGSFRLLKGAPIAETPELYGITLRDDPTKRWHHLEYADQAPKEPTAGRRAAERIQRLYPEVALVDVPEDILYTADRRPGIFRDFFDAPVDQSADGPEAAARPAAVPGEAVVPDGTAAPDGTLVRLAEGCELKQVHITNSGAVHFADDHRATFEASDFTITIAVDRGRRCVYPLLGEEERVVSRVDDTWRSLHDLVGTGRPGDGAAVVARLSARGLLEVTADHRVALPAASAAR
ncbi:radical SAM protein [Plantactinospora sp. GCM10030261]|uniref:radical SAM protein n=1 Tax=Plantactinospora sp. GCM10030261 TaxID=3273420 RepID=UPI00360AABD0